MNTVINRRPIRSRQTKLAIVCAKWLTKKDVRANHVSLASLFFASLAALAMVASSIVTTHYHASMLLLAIVFIVLRLLCNLFDGMIAIEGGKATKNGEIFNDLPDRPADILILVASGYVASTISFGMTLGFLAAMLALLTAYVRLLGNSLGTRAYFNGPMAKQQRMAVMIVASLVSASVADFYTPYIFMCALLIIVAGCTITIIRRLRLIFQELAMK